jgi:hypothetical protein
VFTQIAASKREAMDGSEAKMDRTDHDQGGPVRSEAQAKQGGPPKLTVLVLVASLALAVIVGAMLFTGADEVAPNRPAAVESPANPPANPGNSPANPGSSPPETIKK